MARTQASIVINRPVGQVFAYVANPDKWPEWLAGNMETQVTSAGPVGVGATIRSVGAFLGQRFETMMVVAECEANTKFSTRSISGPFSFESTHTFEPVNGGTRLTHTLEGELGGFFKLAEPLLDAAVKRQSEGNYKTLKHILESQA
jgi:ribosome-associated toxin RatA of RatAB toxin-antitoxin module